MKRLARASRIEASENSLRFVRFLDDFPVQPIVNLWEDTNRAGYIDEKQYVVQTSAKVIERCLLMTTDPGDLVLDPTCGSGTTAYVAEQWGRRWITIDTSRVALALARQRLMTARFAMYRLRPLNAEDVARNPKGTWLSPAMGDGASTADKHTFQCKSVPHITLKSIARNAALDPIFARHEPILAERLKALNAALQRVAPDLRTRLQRKLAEKQRREGKKAVTDADRRRWELPRSAWQAWEAPFDTDPDWPQPLQDALTAYRAAWRAKMDEVNACIAANADSEELVDKPDEVRGVVRVSGPFTVEGVIALEEGPDSPIGGTPGEDLDTFEAQPGELDVANAEAHLDKMLRLLRASGVDFRDNKRLAFARLEPLSGVSLLHAEGAWANGDGQERRVAVSIGPQVGNMSAYQVEQVIRAANRRGYDDLVLAAFGFDAAAQDILEDDPNPDLRCHMALIRPDVVMEDLLKTQPGSQIFTVFSAPRATLRGPDAEGGYEVEVEGMDVYDPVTNTLHPTDKDRMAAWFLDSDYDGRTFCITQAFFPDKAKWQKLAKALGDTGVVEEAAFEALSGTRSLPFPRPANKPEGEPWRVAVKVIDPRGNEGMRVLTIEH
jgi:adenine-specific DNA-methyltransferase